MHSTATSHTRFQSSTILVVVASFVVVVVLVLIASLRPPMTRLWGDEGTYVAMTASLVRDADLAFEEPDRAWAINHDPGPPITVILQQSDDRIYYSKPVIYPILAAPLFWIAGEWGMVATNLAILAIALILTWRHLRKLGDGPSALWVLATFLFCSALLPYVGWKMSDLSQAALTLAGLVLAVGPLQRRDETAGTASAIAAGILLGVAITMRYPSAALAVAVVAAMILHHRYRRALVFCAATLLTLLAVNLASKQLIGTANPYKAVRSSFNQETDYPTPDPASATERFSTNPATQSATWKPPIDVRRSLYSTLYFVIGRHTGLVAYFPVALILVLHCLRNPSRVGFALLAGVVTIIGFYLVWMPGNYFGGSTFVGNRYFLGVFPALLVAVRRLPSIRILVLAWVLAALSWSSALASVILTQDLDPSSQSHTRAGVFRALPFESTAQKIDGVTDRFWDEDFVRFPDPFGKVARWSVRLDSERPGTDVMIATDWPGESMLFLLSSSDPSVHLEIQDWRSGQEFSFPQPKPQPPGLIEVQPSAAWRKHPFWWRGTKLYAVRTLRLKLLAGTDEPSTAIVRYLGKGRSLAPISAEYLGEPLPEEISAGSTTPVDVRVRNTGRRPWDYDAILPIQIGYRILDPASSEVQGHGRARIGSKIRQGEILDMSMDVEWPSNSGEYEVVIELLRGPAGRLGQYGRTPLVTGPVRVTASQ